jgi:hypothetical protein
VATSIINLVAAHRLQDREGAHDVEPRAAGDQQPHDQTLTEQMLRPGGEKWSGIRRWDSSNSIASPATGGDSKKPCAR